jgi:signal recognition particle GTPase
LTIDAFLQKLSAFVGDNYGRQFRNQFKDSKGSSELAMLASPSSEEYDQLKTAVAIMTADEKENAGSLDDEQVFRIASDAGIDTGKFAIFINGFALELKRLKQ